LHRPYAVMILNSLLKGAHVAFVAVLWCYVSKDKYQSEYGDGANRTGKHTKFSKMDISLLVCKILGLQDMTKFITICFVFLWFRLCSFGTELSETNGGYFLAVGGARSGTNEAIECNEDLVFRVFYTLYSTNGPNLLNLEYPDVEHCLKIDMTGPDGNAVPKTSVGKIVGSLWDKLHDRRDSKAWFDILAGNGYDPNIGADGGQLLMPADTFFRITRPGVYTLQIELQMLRYTSSLDPNEQYRNLIRFGPIKIKVVKP
jgi:hypothetical protein